MNDLMLHGVLNAPYPDDPSKLDLVSWSQFRDRAKESSNRIFAIQAFLNDIDGEAGLTADEVDKLCGIAYGRTYERVNWTNTPDMQIATIQITPYSHVQGPVEHTYPNGQVRIRVGEQTFTGEPVKGESDD